MPDRNPGSREPWRAIYYNPRPSSIHEPRMQDRSAGSLAGKISHITMKTRDVDMAREATIMCSRLRA